MEHFSLLNLLFCKFPFTLMVPKINTMHQVLIFLDCQGHVWQIKFSCINTGSRDGGNLHNYVHKQHNSQQHSRVTRYSNINFICPKFNRVTEGGRSFAVSTCQLWNSLSLDLRNAVSLESFKNNYRNILFKEQQELHHFIV